MTNSGLFDLAVGPESALQLRARKAEFGSDSFDLESHAPEADPLVVELTLQPGSGSVSGVVRNEHGDPIPQALVELRSRETDHRVQCLADAAGAYRFAKLKPGAYQLKAAPPGYQWVGGSGQWTYLRVEVDELQVPLTVVGTTRSVIAGTVVDTEGRPLPGAKVFIHGPCVKGKSTLGPHYGGKETSSDPEGRFKLAALPEGLYALGARHSDYLIYWADDVESSTLEHQIIMGKGTSVLGRVIDAQTGRPVEQFELSAQGAYRRNPNLHSQRYFQVESSQGEFSLRQLSSAMRQIAVRSPGYVYAWRKHSKGPAHREIEDFEVRLVPFGGLKVTVQTHDQRPISGAQLLYTFDKNSEPSNKPQHLIAQSDASGAALISMLPSLRGQLRVEHVDYLTQKHTVEADSEPQALTLQLTQGITLTGRVRRNTAHVYDATVTATAGGYSLSAQTDRTGRFTIRESRAGLVELTVRTSPVSGVSQSLKLTRMAPERATPSLDVDLPVGTCCLNVSLDPRGMQLSWASVFITSSANNKVTSSWQGHADSGHATFNDLPPGTYKGWIACGTETERRWMPPFSIHLNEGEEATTTMALGSRAIQGKVRDELEESAIVEVELFRGHEWSGEQDNSQPPAASTYANESNSFSLRGLLPGKYTLILTCHGLPDTPTRSWSRGSRGTRPPPRSSARQLAVRERAEPPR